MASKENFRREDLGEDEMFGILEVLLLGHLGVWGLVLYSSVCVDLGFDFPPSVVVLQALIFSTMGKGKEGMVYQATESSNIRLANGLLRHNRFEALSEFSDILPTPAVQMRTNLQVGMVPYAVQADPFCGFQTSIKRIIIPTDKVGEIIGKRAECVRRLEDESGARIIVTRDMHADPCSATRDVDLIGTPHQIMRAGQLINDIILKDFNQGFSKNIRKTMSENPNSCNAERFTLVEGFKVKVKYYDLYRAIKQTYGDLRQPSILDASEMAVVWIVSDLLSIVHAMSQESLLNMTVEVLDDWDKKIRLAEHFNYNVGWIRDHFEKLQTEFERKVSIDAEVSESFISSKLKQSGVESVEAVISYLTSRLERAKETLSVLQPEDEDSFAWIAEENQENTKLQYSSGVTNGCRFLSGLLTSKLCFFCVLIYAMFTMLSQ